MANNRMWLKHKETGDRILLAKYYPQSHWYCFHDKDALDNWLESHTKVSQWGNIDFELEFEINDG